MNIKIKKFLTIITILANIFAFPMHSSARINTETDAEAIRVGLTTSYADVHSVTVHNESLEIGYCVSNAYTKESVISGGAFTFTPFSGHYFVLNNQYKNLKDAIDVADKISQIGVAAYPVAVYRNCYKVYVVGDEASGADILEKINNRFGFTYSGLQSGNPHIVKVSYQNNVLLCDGSEYGAYPQFISSNANGSSDSIVNLGERQYRGRMEIGTYGKNSLTAVNIVNLEQYLYGVVPSEMVSSWNIEALKAQAVCARSFVVQTAGYGGLTKLDLPYKIGDSTLHQVYKGYGHETERTNRAVEETKGEMLYYNYMLVKGYYSSTSGGSTENIEDVWGRPAGYLRHVPDLYELRPEKAPWKVAMTESEILEKLRKRDIHLNRIVDIRPEATTMSGRIYSLFLKGTNENVSLTKDSVRTHLGLFSSKYKVVKFGDTPDLVHIKGRDKQSESRISNSYIISGNNQVSQISQSLDQYVVISGDNLTSFSRTAPENKDTYFFVGMGYGHGVGMSQSGARGMADAGYTYDEILKHYYTDIEVR